MLALIRSEVHFIMRQEHKVQYHQTLTLFNTATQQVTVQSFIYPLEWHYQIQVPRINKMLVIIQDKYIVKHVQLHLHILLSKILWLNMAQSFICRINQQSLSKGLI